MPTTADYVSLATFTTLTPGETYTALVSVKRASDAPTVKIDANGTLSSTISSTAWTDVSVTFVADGTDYVRLVPQTNAAGRVSVDKLQVVLGTTAGSWFDGTTSSSTDFSYVWSGTANASTAIQRGLPVKTSADSGVATGTATQSKTQFRTGTSSTVVNAPKQNSGAATSIISSLDASSPYTASAWIKGETGKTVYLKLEELTSASASVGVTNGTAVTMDGTWQRVSVTRTFGSTGVKAKISVLNGSTTTQVFYYDNLMLEKSPAVQTYFDGSDTSTDSDLTIVWTGTANDSTSAYRGGSSDSYSGFGGSVVSSATTQKYSGSKSAKVYYTTSTSLTNGLAFADSLEASTVYTASAWVYTPTGSSLPQFSIQGSGFTTVNGTAAVSFNTWERISISFVTDAAQSYDILILNSTSSAEDTFFYVDNFMLEVSPTLRDYFDGSSVSSVSDIPISWSGAANASTSVQTGPALTEYVPAGQGTRFAKTGTSFYAGASSSYVLAADIDHGMVTSSFSAHTANVSYTSSAWVKGEAGKLLRIAISEYTSGDVLVGTTSSSNVTMTGSWQRISVSRTFGSTGAKSKTTIQNRTSGSHAFYVDALMIVDAAFEGNYFDGNSTDTSGALFEWTGTENASTSTLTTADLIATNLITNPSMERVTTGTTTLRTNLCTNPSMEVVAWDGYDATSEADLSTIEFYTGTQSTRVSPSESGTKGITIAGGSVVAGSSYTLSSWIRRTAGSSSVSVQIMWFNGATLITDSTSAPVTPSLDTWYRASITATAPPTATSAVLNVILNSAVALIDIAYFDAVLFEQTDQLRPFFDGATTDTLGWDYGWSGTANESTSTAKAAAIVTRTNLITNPTFESGTSGWGFSGSGTGAQSADFALSGTKSLKAVTTGAGYGPSIVVSGVTSGATYYGSAWVYTTTGGTFRTQTGSTLGTSVVVPANTWTRVGGAGAATSTDLGFYVLQINAAGTFYVDNVLVEQSSTLNTYFDGSTGNSGDTMVTAWTGTANASTSTQSSVRVNTLTAVNSAAVQSSNWLSTGTNSLRVTPTTSSTASYGYVTLSTIVGATYTVSARVRLSGAQTGTLNTNARRISAWDSTIASRLAQSSAAANAAGITSLSTTFVATTSTTNILLYNGASVGNGDVWFDDLAVIEGTYVGPYFSGATQPDADLAVAWAGTEHDSISTLSAIQINDWTSTYGASVYRSALFTKSGGYSAKVLCDGTSTYQGIYMYNKPVVSPSNIYTASAWVLAEPGKSIRIGIQELTSAGAVVGTTYSSNTVATGSWQRFSVTRTFGSTGAKANVFVSNVSASSHIFYVDDVLIDASSSVRDYFDGSTGNAGDFAYSWTGASDGSTSISYGVGVANVDVGTGRVAVQSTDWAGTGSRSVRVIATGTNAATDSENGLIIASTGSATNSVVLDRNQTYTIYGTLRMSAPQTGVVDSSKARRIWFSANGGSTVSSSSVQSANSAGSYNHALTILTSATGDNIVSLGTGMEAGGGDIWWDKIMVVKGAYSGDYFDGSLPDTADITYVWNGDTDASTSAIEVNPLTNWTGINGAVVYQDSSNKYSGNKSALVTCTGVVGLQGVQLINRATVTPSTQYYASAWVKGVAGKTLRIELQEWTASGTYIGSSTSAGTVANGAWQRLSVSRTMSSTGARAEVVITNVQATAHTFYVDNVLLEAASGLQAYFDGNYPAQGDFSYTWNGTPEASTSQYQAPSVNHVAPTGALAIQSSECEPLEAHSPD